MVERETVKFSMVEREERGEEDEGEILKEGSGRVSEFLWGPVVWFKMLADEMHWSFVFAVVIVYGISQGMGGALFKVGTDYYMKDIQKVQPSEAQIYSGIVSIPWIIKPLWGLFTDVVPIAGYQRRPYFVIAGIVGMLAMIVLSLHKVHLVLAVALLTAGSAGVAIADVTIDACVAQNSISHPSLAADMQSLCAMSSSVGALVGFFISGILVDLIGPMGVYSLLAIPFLLVLLVGVLLDEPHLKNFAYGQKFIDAGKAMWTTLKCSDVWRPCVYMYVSFSLSLNILGGMFYWYTDAKEGPHFSEETVGYLFSIGSIGSFLGAMLYQHVLRDHPFRDVLFWAQLLLGLSGMLDLVLVLRLNLKLNIPDFVFAVIDESVAKMINNLKWMPMYVLSTKLCPQGIQGTFFALLMSIDNAGLLSASWGGGILLHFLKVTRTQFDNLWVAILIRNVFRVSPLCLLFLVPRGDPTASILRDDRKRGSGSEEDCEISREETKNIELVALVDR